MVTLTPITLRSLIDKPGRHSDGGGLYFRVLPGHKAYFTYRYSVGGRANEMSLGPYPELSLAEARVKHVAARKMVRVDKIDPIAERRKRMADPAERRSQIVERRRASLKPLTRAEAPDLKHLYRHYDFDGKLLYVGVSNNVLRRWDDHKHKATWADQVAVITVDHYPTREAAEDAEADAILAEKPRFNSHVRINQQKLRVLRRSRRKLWPKPEATEFRRRGLAAGAPAPGVRQRRREGRAERRPSRLTMENKSRL